MTRKRRSVKRPRHSVETKAKVVAALMLGASVSEVARQFKLPHQTVSNYKAEIPADYLGELRRKKGDMLDELVYDHMTTALVAMREQATALGDPTWIRKQSAGKLALAHGILADKVFRLLAATTKPSGE
jgi:transposase-like protein